MGYIFLYQLFKIDCMVAICKSYFLAFRLSGVILDAVIDVCFSFPFDVLNMIEII